MSEEQNTGETPKRTDPDNVFVSEGKKDPSKLYIYIPFNYRDAQVALKEAGAKWRGNQWEIDKDAWAGAEQFVREAARSDIMLGKEGRKAREDELRAEREAAAQAEAPVEAEADSPSP